MAKEEIVTTLEEINQQISSKGELPEVESEGTPIGFPPEPKETPRKQAKEQIDIEIVDDTPPEDRGRKPMKVPPKEADEIDNVNEFEEIDCRHPEGRKGLELAGLLE
jgi:hypothetical protein